MSQPSQPKPAPAKPAQPSNAAVAAPKRQLNLFDSTCIIVGIIIGAGIFASSPTIAGALPNATWLYIVWLLGGLLSFFGSLCYAELGTAYPKSGGDYVFLSKAFGRSPGFMFAWAQFWIIRPGSIGAMAFAFANYANSIYPNYEGEDARYVLLAYTCGAIIFFSAINILGVSQGKWTQNILTSVKVLGLGAIVIVGIFLVNKNTTTVAPTSAPETVKKAAEPTDASTKTTDTDVSEMSWFHTTLLPIENIFRQIGGILSMLGFPLMMVLFTYGGWNEMAYVGAEVKNPDKNIFRALMLGTISVTLIYVLINYAFVNALGFEGVKQKTCPADVIALVLGDRGHDILSLLVCISCLGAVHGNIFTGARINYALGTEHRLYAWLGKWSGKTGTPVSSLLIQAAITLMLVLYAGLRTAVGSEGLRNGFDQMVIFTTPVFWFFMTLVGLSVMELRWRDPETKRPIRVPLYPLPPIILCMFSMYLVYSSLDYALKNESWEAVFSLIILALGVVMCFFDPAMPRGAAKKES
jgi:basic amino acid/polyamine antiporter, APA family